MVHDLNPKGSADYEEVKVESSHVPNTRTKVKALTDLQLQKFQHKRFERPRVGKYTMIFPFNQASHDLAVLLNKQVGSGQQININGPSHSVHMKTLISEIKQYYDEKISLKIYW